MRRHLLLLLALVACGGDDKKTTDGGSAPKADASLDAAAAVVPDVTKYCTDIIAHCTGENAQYPTATAMDQCLGTAATWPVGHTGDATGNTLGCREYHAGALAVSDPATHCIHAGPGGDQMKNAGTCGDPCTSFCTLQIGTCGSIDTPVTGITPQYQNIAACMTACANFDKDHLYVLNKTPATPSGNSLACRLYHATNAALYRKRNDLPTASAHCGHAAATPTGPCSAAATP